MSRQPVSKNESYLQAALFDLQAAQASGGTTLRIVLGAGTVAEQSAAAAKAASGPQSVFIGNGVGHNFWNQELPNLLINIDKGKVPTIEIHF